MSQNEAAFFNLFLEFLVAVHAGDAAVAVIERFLIDICLNVLKQILHVLFDTLAGTCLLLQCIATHDFHCIVLQVAATHHQTNGNTLHLIVGKLEARTFVVGIVVLHGNTH